jgi:hypothetical protein
MGGDAAGREHLRADDPRYSECRRARPIYLRRRPFIITRTLNDTLMAQSGKEGVILQTASRVFVAAHFVEGQVMNNVAGRVARLVSQLTALGC